MFARVTTIQISPYPLNEAIGILREQVAPAMQQLMERQRSHHAVHLPGVQTSPWIVWKVNSLRESPRRTKSTRARWLPKRRRVQGNEDFAACCLSRHPRQVAEWIEQDKQWNDRADHVADFRSVSTRMANNQTTSMSTAKRTQLLAGPFLSSSNDVVGVVQRSEENCEQGCADADIM